MPEAIAGIRHGFETFAGDFLLAFLAAAESPLLDAGQCLVDLFQNLLFVFDKTAMWELERTQGTKLPRAVGERLKTESRDTVMGIRAILSRVCSHRLAKLVYQGSYPRLPHQALVTRESARLFQRLCALGSKGVLGSSARSG
jgi:hypothetical protein